MFDRFLAGKQSFLHCNNIAKTFFLQAFLKTRTLPSKQSFVCAQQFQVQQLIIIIKKNKNKGTCKTQRDQSDISRSTTIAMATLIKVWLLLSLFTGGDSESYLRYYWSTRLRLYMFNRLIFFVSLPLPRLFLIKPPTFPCFSLTCGKAGSTEKVWALFIDVIWP